MKRENRYIVIKIEDLNALNNQDKVDLQAVLLKISNLRELKGKKPNKKYVVVSEDWPMYEQTWKAIEEWVDGMEPVK
jgi:hypothetical protein